MKGEPLVQEVPPVSPGKFFRLNQVPLFHPERVMTTFEECAATCGDVVRVSLAGIQQTMLFPFDHVTRFC